MARRLIWIKQVRRPERLVHALDEAGSRPARDRHAGPYRRASRQGISSIGTLQRASTPVVTDPNRTLPSAEWPWVPMTIKSGFRLDATAAIDSAA
jgi:hypothetical protein